MKVLSRCDVLKLFRVDPNSRIPGILQQFATCWPEPATWRSLRPIPRRAPRITIRFQQGPACIRIRSRVRLMTDLIRGIRERRTYKMTADFEIRHRGNI